MFNFLRRKKLKTKISKEEFNAMSPDDQDKFLIHNLPPEGLRKYMDQMTDLHVMRRQYMTALTSLLEVLNKPKQEE